MASQTISEMALEALIQTRALGRVRDLRVQIIDGRVQLQGRACSYYVKQLAQQAVFEAGRWPLAANEIEVGGRD